jgi:hypothetical protein
MNRHKLFSVLFGLALLHVVPLAAMVFTAHNLLHDPRPVIEVLPDLVGLQHEIARQKGMADAFVASKREMLLETSRLIPPAIREGLDRFFGDERAQVLFSVRHKDVIVAHTVARRMQRSVEMRLMRLRLLQEKEAAYETQCHKQVVESEVFDKLFEGLACEFGLADHSSHGNNFILTSSAWPGYVVKIAKYRWVDNDAMIVFPYQLISRVFYNREINDFIAAHDFDRYLVQFPKSLYHIPGTPDDVNDDNYVVVEPLLPCPSPEVNEGRFMSLKKEAIVANPEHPAVPTLQAVIRHSGLWCLSFSNVYLLDDGRFVFVDTERPGLGGSEWRFFFHQGEGAAAEIARNAGGGLEWLHEVFGVE